MQGRAEEEISRLDREAAEHAAACRVWAGFALGGWVLAIVLAVLLVVR